MVQNERVVAVETSKGMIECDYIVNTGGLWARNIGQMSEPQVKVPVHPAEHYFLYTQKLDEIDPMMPGMNLKYWFFSFFLFAYVLALEILSELCPF